MTTKRMIFLFVAFLCTAMLHAQEDPDETTTNDELLEEVVEEADDYNDTWKTAQVTDDMTVDPDQNKEWRMGQYKYSAKPKDALEIGISGGHFMIDGDVDRELPAGWGASLHLRKAIHYVFSLRGSVFYGEAKGLDPQPSGDNLLPENQADGIFAGYGPNNRWFFSHKTTYITATLEGVLNIGNLLFHKERNKWNWYAALGGGFDTHKTMLDLRDANGDVYTDLVDFVDFDRGKVDTRDGRIEIKNDLREMYDGVYETEGPKKKAIFRIGDETNVHFVFSMSSGISRKISKRLNLGLEHKVMVSDNDFLDGQKYRTAIDQTNNVDIGHFTSLVIGLNLGNFDKRTEPLYWLNPLDAAFNDIAELKQRPQLDLTDEDDDGVIDMLDQELDTPDGCAVDTRGIILDSDGDGIPDCKDLEPYSPPGLEIDETGVAEAPECCVTEETIKEYVSSEVEPIQNKVDNLGTAVGFIPSATEGGGGTTTSPSTSGGSTVAGGGTVTTIRSGCGEWFLPMIHFDNDKDVVKQEYYSQMHHVAQVLEKCPELCVVAHGHTDSKNSSDYNKVLSYNRAKNSIDYLTSNYGIDRSRLKLMYGGEETPLGGVSGSHYMNRRVEFRTCDSNDFDMAEPAGSYDQGATGGESINNYYNGNKNSGY